MTIHSDNTKEGPDLLGCTMAHGNARDEEGTTMVLVRLGSKTLRTQKLTTFRWRSCDGTHKYAIVAQPEIFTQSSQDYSRILTEGQECIYSGSTNMQVWLHRGCATIRAIFEPPKFSRDPDGGFDDLLGCANIYGTCITLSIEE